MHDNTWRTGKHVAETCALTASNNFGAEAAVSRANESSVLITRLIAAVNDVKHRGSIAWVMNPHSMSYSTVLANFKVENESYLSTKD